MWIKITLPVTLVGKLTRFHCIRSFRCSKFTIYTHYMDLTFLLFCKFCSPIFFPLLIFDKFFSSTSFKNIKLILYMTIDSVIVRNILEYRFLYTVCINIWDTMYIVHVHILCSKTPWMWLCYFLLIQNTVSIYTTHPTHILSWGWKLNSNIYGEWMTRTTV